MRICRYCGIEKEESEYEIAATIKGKRYLRWKCKTCYGSMKHDRRLIIRKWLKDYKSDKICVRCGFADVRALCFHHTDPSIKDGDISVLASNGSASIERIQKEIDKCEVLCSNCHTIEHAMQRDVD